MMCGVFVTKKKCGIDWDERLGIIKVVLRLLQSSGTKDRPAQFFWDVAKREKSTYNCI